MTIMTVRQDTVSCTVLPIYCLVTGKKQAPLPPPIILSFFFLIALFIFHFPASLAPEVRAM